MTTKTISLRDKPVLKMLLHQRTFDAIDDAEPANKGTYDFKKLKNVTLEPRQTDWLVSALSMAAALITDYAGVDIYRNQAHLMLAMDSGNLKYGSIKLILKKHRGLLLY